MVTKFLILIATPVTIIAALVFVPCFNNSRAGEKDTHPQ
jgi:hypothetical protein